MPRASLASSGWCTEATARISALSQQQECKVLCAPGRWWWLVLIQLCPCYTFCFVSLATYFPGSWRAPCQVQVQVSAPLSLSQLSSRHKEAIWDEWPSWFPQQWACLLLRQVASLPPVPLSFWNLLTQLPGLGDPGRPMVGDAGGREEGHTLPSLPRPHTPRQMTT